jgi:Holliday junction resolvasome RuvABC endonuclease subunit
MAMPFDADQKKCKLIHFPGETGFRRLQLIAKGVHNTVSEWKPDSVLIEGYAIGNRFTRTEMVECGTVVRMALHQLGLKWYEVSPTSLKKWVAGSGKADKKKMAEAVEQRWGFCSKYDDIVDAFALAQLGQHIEMNGITSDLKGITCGH